MTFKSMRISELITEIAMGPFGSNIKKDCFVNSGTPVLNGSNLVGFRLKEDSFGYITEEKATSLKNANAYRGDIVVTHRGTLGQIVYIPHTSKYDRYVISQSQFRLHCNDKILPEFMVYYFHTKVGQYKLLSNASQVGVPALARPTTTFKNISIEVPDVTTQQRIVSLISLIEDKIEKNNEINHCLEEQCFALYQDLFVVNAKPEWKVGTISDLGNVVGGSTPSKAKPEYYCDRGIAWITPKDLSICKDKFISHGLDDITSLGLKNSSVQIMPRGTVLFSSRAPIGYIAIARNEVCTNQGFKSVVPADSIGTAYVYYYLSDNLPTIEGRASGSTFKEVSGSTMKSIPAMIPDDQTLRVFAEFCSPIFNEQELLEVENAKLAEVRDLLLPKLMSGEIDVSDVDI